MAYENLKLLVAGMSGEIYLSKTLQSGLMGDSRRVITDECLRATTDWFMSNKHKRIRSETILPNKEANLFFTDDKEKAKKIIAILKEE